MLPAASVAVNTTVVAPNGNVARPSLVTVTLASTLSVADAPAKKAVMALLLATVPFASVAAMVTAAGAVTTGAA